VGVYQNNLELPALATGVALSRYPAKKHYLSDVLVGATVGYVTGSYAASH